MSQNLIDVSFTAEQLAAIDATIATLESQFAELIALTPDDRQGLVKMGDKSEAFCRKAVEVFGQHSGVLPRNFDLDTYRRDLTALDALRPRMMRLSRLTQRGADTEMALGSDLMNASLEGYGVLKVAGKGEGLDDMRKLLSVRFNRAPKSQPKLEPVEA